MAFCRIQQAYTSILKINTLKSVYNSKASSEVDMSTNSTS